MYDWPAISRFYASGATYRQCKERFGVSLKTLWKAARSGKIKPRSQANGMKLTTAEFIARHQGRRGSNIRERLRAKVLADGKIPYRCAECGLDEWRGKPLTLRIDHIDGDGGNHSETNLRFMCPNCDSQLPTYGHRNRGRYRARGGMADASGSEPDVL